MMPEPLAHETSAWLNESGIVVSSRVRLARNVAGCAFPGWADAAANATLCEQLREAVCATPTFHGAQVVPMADLTPLERELLKERHLISHELASKEQGSALVLSADRKVAVMVNEEDHLRLQAISPGQDVEQVWERLDQVDDEIEERVEYAFSPRLGYLTACPSNVGTAMRGSVMMHLSGLRLANRIDGVIRGLEKLGFVVRGLFGEGSEASGNLYQVSNLSSLGEDERQILARLRRVVTEVVQHERDARQCMIEERPEFVMDQVARAYGLLMHARLINSVEAVDLLAGLRLGVELAVVDGITVRELNEAMLYTQPAHLQLRCGREIESEERDRVRANMIRERLTNVKLA